MALQGFRQNFPSPTWRYQPHAFVILKILKIKGYSTTELRPVVLNLNLPDMSHNLQASDFSMVRPTLLGWLLMHVYHPMTAASHDDGHVSCSLHNPLEHSSVVPIT